MPSLQDKVVVITGSTRGFGYAIAKAMLEAGAKVIISGRDPATLEKALDSLQSKGTVSGLTCDVRHEAQVHALADAALERFGRLDIWVNNAGYSAAAGRILDMDPQDALAMFKANDLGTMHGSQAALLRMQSGVLVNIYGAGSTLRPSSPTGLYAATKAWTASFTRTLAKEMKGSGVQIIGFNPGMMLTDMLTHPTVVGTDGREMLKNYGFVLRMLARRPEQSARDLVRVISRARKPFSEYRVMKPWTPFVGLLRILWENLKRKGEAPAFELEVKEAYRPPGNRE